MALILICPGGPKLAGAAMDHPRIDRIELTPAHVPFRPVVREAMAASEGGLGMAIAAEEAWLGGDFVICKLRAEDGSVGLGEAFVWLPETGVSPQQIIDAIENALGRYVLGESPFRVERIRHRMDCNVSRSEVAKGLLDMACYDLIAEPLDYQGGTVRVPSGPGFGVELDEDALAGYALSSSVVLEVR
jgi:L-alanine-DL-glutamate epimerase-like enolase superfamily enzyme